MWIFVNGKQKRVRRPPTVDGMGVEEFIERNADPIFLHQNELWEDMKPMRPPEGWDWTRRSESQESTSDSDDDDSIPF